MSVGHISYPHVVEIAFEVDAPGHHNLQGRRKGVSVDALERIGAAMAAYLAATSSHAVGKAIWERPTCSSGPEQR